MRSGETSRTRSSTLKALRQCSRGASAITVIDEDPASGENKLVADVDELLHDFGEPIPDFNALV
jgi:hypothetical protein